MKRKAAARPSRRRGFPVRLLADLRDAPMLGIRAGTGAHKFTGIWVVVIGKRVFVRPWNDKPGGWYEAISSDPRGAIGLAGREIPVRARATRSERLFDVVDRAYAEKYDSKADLKWVRGFKTARRRKTTTELLPA